MPEKSIGPGSVAVKKFVTFPHGALLILKDAFKEKGTLKKFNVYFVTAKNEVRLQIWRPDGDEKDPSFFLVYEQQVVAKGTGPKEVPVMQGVDIEKGDHLGLTTGKGAMAVGYKPVDPIEFITVDETTNGFKTQKHPYEFSVSATILV